MAAPESLITIVGCGPGAADYVTPAARSAAGEAEVLVGSKRLLALFPESRAERIPVVADVGAALSEIAARAGRRVAVLVSGDAGLCSLASSVIRRFGLAACRVVPGISSVQVACARLGLDWGSAKIVSAHGRQPDVSAAELAGVNVLIVLAGTPDAMKCAAGLAAMMGSGCRARVCEDLTLATERVREVSPEALGGLEASSLSIVVLTRKGAD